MAGVGRQCPCTHRARAAEADIAPSAHLAGVLTGLGISVVYARNFAGKRFQQGERFRRFFRALPLLSATAITLAGLWLCYDSLHHR